MTKRHARAGPDRPSATETRKVRSRTANVAACGRPHLTRGAKFGPGRDGGVSELMGVHATT